MPRFDLNNYEPVEDRLARFWEEHPDGARVLTEIVKAEGGEFIVKATIYEDLGDERPVATGYAHELVGSSPVNKTSALENCETSAIGRALANLGYAPKGARPSREEMEKANRSESVAAPDKASAEQVAAIRESAQNLGMQGGVLAKWIGNLLGREVKGYGALTAADAHQVLSALIDESIVRETAEQ